MYILICTHTRHIHLASGLTSGEGSGEHTHTTTHTQGGFAGWGVAPALALAPPAQGGEGRGGIERITPEFPGDRGRSGAGDAGRRWGRGGGEGGEGDDGLVVLQNGSKDFDFGQQAPPPLNTSPLPPPPCLIPTTSPIANYEKCPYELLWALTCACACVCVCACVCECVCMCVCVCVCVL